MTRLMTTGDLANHLDVPRWKIDYVITKSGIRERSRAGILRLFSDQQLPEFREALAALRIRTSDRTTCLEPNPGKAGSQ